MATEWVIVLRLLLAGVLGAAIGYQRERAGKSAGLRTHVLICIGSALFTVSSIFGFGPGVDITRIAAGVVTGIGFLGAGSILRRAGGVVEGLTTAATMWVVAGIGLATGAGLYLAAGVTTVIVLAVLMLPHPIR
ncbi:MAG: MgtC/SapB family protein [Chloroflexi bacterium]|nr:MgtC/SapB family protein [Chloroflexota bacterium]